MSDRDFIKICKQCSTSCMRTTDTAYLSKANQTETERRKRRKCCVSSECHSIYMTNTSLKTIPRRCIMLYFMQLFRNNELKCMLCHVTPSHACKFMYQICDDGVTSKNITTLRMFLSVCVCVWKQYVSELRGFVESMAHFGTL